MTPYASLHRTFRQAEKLIKGFESIWGSASEEPTASDLIRRGANAWRIMHALSRLEYLTVSAGLATVDEFHADDTGVAHYLITLKEGRSKPSRRSVLRLARRVAEIERRLDG